MEKLAHAYLKTFYDDREQPTLTSVAYGNDLDRWLAFLRRHLGREPQPTDLTVENVRAFLDAEAKDGVALTTLRRRVSVLRGLQRFAVSQGVKADTLGRPRDLLAPYLKGKFQPASPRVLRAEHVTQLRQALRRTRIPLALRDWAVLCLILETGLPVRRVVALDLSDLDWEARRIRMPLFAEEIWLSLEEAYDPLKDYVENGRPDLLTWPQESALFISQGGRRLSRQSLWQLLRHWGEDADLPFRLTPRLLRDTAALRLLQRGIQVKQAGRLLGHTNPLSMQAMVRRLSAVASEHNVLYPLGGTLER